MSGNVRIDLSESGFLGQWIEIVDIGGRSPKQFRKIQELATSDSQQGARAFVAAVVTAWNVLDPETGSPIPSPDDPALDLECVPMRVTRILNDEVTRQLEDVVPKGSLSSLTPTSSTMATT